MTQIGYLWDDDLACEVVVIEDEAGEQWLEIQRGLDFDEQDVALGMDTYCLVRDGAATHYGGVRIWNLAEGVLTLHLTGEAAAALSLERRVRFTVDTDGESVLRECLPRILG